MDLNVCVSTNRHNILLNMSQEQNDREALEEVSLSIFESYSILIQMRAAA